MVDTVSRGIFLEEDVRLSPKTHAAADFLVHRAGEFMTPHTSVKVLPLTNLRDPLLMTKFAKVIPERIALRLAGLGYPVDISAVLTDEMHAPLHSAGSDRGNASADVTLSGVFRRKNQEILVSVRLTQLSSGNVLSAHEFTVPLNREMAELTKPAPSVTRTTP